MLFWNYAAVRVYILEQYYSMNISPPIPGSSSSPFPACLPRCCLPPLFSCRPLSSVSLSSFVPTRMMFLFPTGTLGFSRITEIISSPPFFFSQPHDLDFFQVLPCVSSLFQVISCPRFAFSMPTVRKRASTRAHTGNQNASVFRSGETHF